MISALRSLRVASAKVTSSRVASSLSATVSDWTESRAFFQDSDRPQISFSANTAYEFSGDILVVPFYKPKEKGEQEVLSALKSKIPVGLPAATKSIIGELLGEGDFKADATSKLMTKVVGNPSIKYVCLVGLGPDPKGDKASDMEIVSANRLGKTIGSIVKETKIQSVGVVPPTIGNAGLTQMILGLYESAYTDNRFKKLPENGHKTFPLKTLTVLGVSASAAKDMGTTATLTKMIASGVDLARDLVGAPPNSKTPTAIAQLAQNMAATSGLDCKVLGEEECKKRGMGGYLGVQQGSKFPPQFIHLTYKPAGVPEKDLVKVALVGKGLTFDSGGYNLKSGAGSMIELMKFDMGGCGAVLGCAKAISQLRPKNVEVHFISAVCENMISDESMRPGDILVASNGKTIEVLNTDAEGRLTLADALVYADGLGVDIIVDLATLTGACIVALGEKVAGLYSPDKKLREDLEAAGLRTDEGLWAMPLEANYKELIKSTIADLKNIGSKGGGSITAALFLEEFVENAKWAHIDMAGPVWDTKDNKPTGYGVKFLTDFLLNLRK